MLLTGRYWTAQYEFSVHHRVGARAGIGEETIAAIVQGKRPAALLPEELPVYDFVTELTATQKVSDATYARAKKVFSDQQIVDLTAVAGNYVMVAMILAATETTVPPDKEEPFKVGEE